MLVGQIPAPANQRLVLAAIAMADLFPSAEAIALVMRIKGIYRHGHEHDEAAALALDALAARSRREAITECADVCRSLGQYSGRNVQPAIEQIADQIAALNEKED